MASTELLALQEVRRKIAQLRHHLPGHAVWMSSYAHGRAGGIAFVASPAVASSFESIEHKVVVRGPIGILHCRGRDGMRLDVANVHVYHERLSEAAMLRLHASRLRPAHECMTIAIGDFNSAAPDE